MTRHLSDTTLTVDQLQSGFGSIRPSGHLPPAERAKWMPTIGTPVELDGQMYGVASLSFSTGAVTYTLHPIIATESAFAWGDRAKDAPLAGGGGYRERRAGVCVRGRACRFG